MIKEKCYQLLGNRNSVSIMDENLNTEKDLYEQFQWFGCENVFDESNKENVISSYYADLSNQQLNLSIDQIFDDRKQVTLINCGKAWNYIQHRSLEDSLKIFGLIRTL